MPLHDRSISISIAVACLFMVAFIGWFTELEPLTCCKRAVIGALITYGVTKTAVYLINHILISALVKSRLEQQQGDINER